MQVKMYYYSLRLFLTPGEHEMQYMGLEIKNVYKQCIKIGSDASARI